MKKLSSFALAMSGILLSHTVLANSSIDGDIVSGEVILPTSTIANAITTKDGKRVSAYKLTDYAQQVNEAEWSPNMNVNTAMTVKLQTLLDWNHVSPGSIDGGWGVNSKQALMNFQKLKGLEITGKMNQETWDALTADIPSDQPVLVSYTLTDADVKGPYATLPADAESRSKLKGLYYENIAEMLGERFHMDVAYVKKINPSKKFVAGETITVINTGQPLDAKVTRVVADKQQSTVYAYSDDVLVAAYPSTIGNTQSAAPTGKFKIANKIEMPTYKATVKNDKGESKSYILPSGPNSPVGVLWMGLDKANCGIHGTAIPEVVNRPSTLGCIRLTNWDAMELSTAINTGATVEIR